MAGIIVLFIVGVASASYFVLYALLVDLGNVFAYFWLMLGILGIGGGILGLLFRRFHITLPVWLVRGGMAAVGLGLLVFVITEGIIIGYGHRKPDGGADYIIVLGARVKGQKITANLRGRLRIAERYLKENPETKAILSGGQGAGEDISEAEAMRRYLVQRGIQEERLLLEDQSVNTDQNLTYSMERMESPDASVVLVTNNFHIFRSMRIAKRKGLTRVQGYGSATYWYTIPNLYVREAFAVLKYAVCGQL